MINDPTMNRTIEMDITSSNSDDNATLESIEQIKSKLRSSTTPNILQKFQNITEILPTGLQKKFKSGEINRKLIVHLSSMKTQVDQLEDFNDANDMQKCTQILAGNHSDINLEKRVVLLFKELDNALEEKKCVCICNTVFNNLEEEMFIFNDDYLSRYLRNHFDLMLIKAQQINNVKNFQNVSDIFFWGTFPLKEAYLRKYFSQELYETNGMQQFNKDIGIYLYKLSKKIERLQICRKYLKIDTIDGHNIFDLRGRLSAKISLLKRPIPMMIELHAATLKIEFTEIKLEESDKYDLPKVIHLREIIPDL